MNAKPDLDELFERRITYPDFERAGPPCPLVGLDDHKARLTKILALLVNPRGSRRGRTSIIRTRMAC